MRWSFWLSVLAALQASANVLPPHDGGGYPSRGLISRRGHFSVNPDPLAPLRLEKRAPRNKCSVRTYNSDDEDEAAKRKRDLSGLWERGFPLERRTMTLPGDGDMNAFMVRETGSAGTQIIWQKKVKGEWEDMATADFMEFKNMAFSYGTGYLCGCTVLYIISRKGVYVAHYWENISFNPDPVWLEKYKDADRAFQQTVIKGLNDGIGKGANIEQVSLRLQVDKIADDDVKAYLMIPSAGNNDEPDPYREKWEKIKETVNGLIPKLKEPDRWTEIKYDALNDDDPQLQNSAKGRTLFKFDPDHNGKRKATMWVEDHREPSHDDEW